VGGGAVRAPAKFPRIRAMQPCVPCSHVCHTSCKLQLEEGWWGGWRSFRRTCHVAQEGHHACENSARAECRRRAAAACKHPTWLALYMGARECAMLSCCLVVSNACTAKMRGAADMRCGCWVCHNVTCHARMQAVLVLQCKSFEHAARGKLHLGDGWWWGGWRGCRSTSEAHV
jgi:hypothetical protein